MHQLWFQILGGLANLLSIQRGPHSKKVWETPPKAKCLETLGKGGAQQCQKLPYIVFEQPLGYVHSLHCKGRRH